MLSQLTVQPIEIAWVLVGLAGIYPSVANFIVHRRERNIIVKKRIDHKAQYFATGVLWIEGLILSMQVVLVMVGVIAMLLPPEVETAEPPADEILGVFILLGLFYIQVALSARSWVSLYIRNYVYAYAASKGEMGEHEHDPGDEEHEHTAGDHTHTAGYDPGTEEGVHEHEDESN